ncbi:MAG: LysR family transcriptional regulator [SAR324 cluster bacterium]|nr:LysR family transcriptional regulator [SAR324 cluster bacterium]
MDQLKVLHTILESGSFRAAAEVLHRAQSAVSYAIKNMEEEFNLQIFTREGYRPVLTPEGKAIYKKAKLVLLQAEELEQLTEHLSMGKESEIKLAVNAICPLDGIASVINQFSKENPVTQIKLSIENLGGSIERLIDGDADMALAESFVWNDQLEDIPWMKIKMIPVAAPDYPLSQSSVPLQKSDMLSYVQIVVSDSSRHSEGKTVGVLTGGTRWTVNDFSVKRNLLIAGSGWGMMPEHMIQQDLDSKRLVRLNYPMSSQLEVQILLIRRNDHPVGPIAAKLWSALQTLKQI